MSGSGVGGCLTSCPFWVRDETRCLINVKAFDADFRMLAVGDVPGFCTKESIAKMNFPKFSPQQKLFFFTKRWDYNAFKVVKGESATFSNDKPSSTGGLTTTAVMPCNFLNFNNQITQFSPQRNGHLL